MHKSLNKAVTWVACAFVAGTLFVGVRSAVAQGQSQDHGQGEGAGAPEIILHKTNPHEIGGAPTAGSTATASQRIYSHGGPVMGTPNVYLIWYGNWNTANGSDNADGVQLVRDFIEGLNNSGYYQINTSYGPTGGITLAAGSYADNYSLGTSLSDANIQTVVKNAIASGNLGTADKNGIYLVLTSSDVTASSGFCTKYCGWHTHSTGMITGTDIKYAFIGNANRCLSSCAAQSVSPNNNAGVDGMISVIAHELEEATTDPDLNAWYDVRGSENADKCAWTFGSSQTKLPSGAYYNMSLTSLARVTHNFLVQRNLDSASKCYVSYQPKIQ